MKKKIISAIILCIFLAWALHYIFNHYDDLKIISNLKYSEIFILAIMHSIFLHNSGLFTKLFLEEFKIRLTINEYFGLSVISTTFNYLTPFRGGAFVRAAYLKRQYDFEYRKSAGTLIGSYIIIYWTNCLFGVLGCVLLYSIEGVSNPMLLSLFVLAFLFLTVLMVFPLRIPDWERLGTLPSTFNSIMSSWGTMRTNIRLLAKLSFITVFNIIVGSAIMYFEFSFLGVNISYIHAIVISMVSALSLLISITPGSLGIKEFVVIFTATIIGISTSDALLVSMIDRGVVIILCFILSLFYSKLFFTKQPPI